MVPSTIHNSIRFYMLYAVYSTLCDGVRLSVCAQKAHINLRVMQCVSIYLIFISQVSTATGIISHFVNLQVVVPEAFILGSGELHVDMGSTINLVCIIEKVRNANHQSIQKQSANLYACTQ